MEAELQPPIQPSPDLPRKLTLDEILGGGGGEEEEEEEGQAFTGQGDEDPAESDDARRHWNLATYLPPAAEESFYFIIGAWPVREEESLKYVL